MEIRLEELQSVCELVLADLRTQGIETVNVPVDYYWHVPKEEAYDPYKQPSNLDLGQLSDDWAELRRVLRQERPPLAYHLVWLAAVLRGVGESVPG